MLNLSLLVLLVGVAVVLAAMFNITTALTTSTSSAMSLSSVDCSLEWLYSIYCGKTEVCTSPHLCSWGQCSAVVTYAINRLAWKASQMDLGCNSKD